MLFPVRIVVFGCLNCVIKSCKWNWVNCVSCKILGRLLLLEFSYVETMIEVIGPDFVNLKL